MTSDLWNKVYQIMEDKPSLYAVMVEEFYNEYGLFKDIYMEPWSEDFFRRNYPDPAVAAKTMYDSMKERGFKWGEAYIGADHYRKGDLIYTMSPDKYYEFCADWHCDEIIDMILDGKHTKVRLPPEIRALPEIRAIMEQNTTKTKKTAVKKAPAKKKVASNSCKPKSATKRK